MVRLLFINAPHKIGDRTVRVNRGIDDNDQAIEEPDEVFA